MTQNCSTHFKIVMTTYLKQAHLFQSRYVFFLNLTSLKLYGGVTVTENSKLLPSCEVMQRKEKSYALQADLDGTL